MKSSTRALAAHYDALYRKTGFGDAPRFYRWIADRADARPDEAVIDIGCGAGGAVAAFAERGVTAIGLDFSRVALTATRAAIPPAPLVEGDGAQLPIATGTIDVLVNLGNLEHFRDLEGGVREMHRVLAPAGRALVLLPNLFYSGVIWRVLRGGEGPNHHQPIDRFATKSEWSAWLEWGGLRIDRVTPYHKGKRWKRLLPRALAWHFLFECRKGEPSRGAPPPAPLGRIEPHLFSEEAKGAEASSGRKTPGR